jgi:hypothetical protein
MQWLQGMRRSHLIFRRLHSAQDKAGRRRFRGGIEISDIMAYGT